ncbi:MAG: alpha-E domain-containing protein [Rubrivivax sp.]|nr:alpha-E domain-containing protein [Rubrivivax sp.]
MLSRTADHLIWRARYMERAGQARSAWGAATTRPRAAARSGVFGLKEIEDAL